MNKEANEMKKWIVRVVDKSVNMVRNVTVKAETKQEAIDKVEIGKYEYIGFCYECK